MPFAHTSGAINVHTEYSGRELLIALKAAAGTPGAQLSIPVGKPPEALLRPVATRTEKINREDVNRLTEWRNRNVQAFLTEFVATADRTTRWLLETVGPNEGKIIFMVDALEGHTCGFMGLDFIDWKDRSGEVDAVVSGGSSPRGLMKLALRALISWATHQLALDRIGVRVRSDNSALKFYQKVGFREVERVPLKRVSREDCVLWMEDKHVKTPDLYLVHLLYDNGGTPD